MVVLFILPIFADEVELKNNGARIVKTVDILI
jgi:hypothetical protein